MAAIIAPPIVVSIIENRSLTEAFLFEAVFFGLIGLLSFLSIRNAPEDIGLTPLQTEASRNTRRKPTRNAVRMYQVDRVSQGCMYAAVLLMGFAFYGVSQYLSPLYTLEGFDSISVSYAMSIYGTALMVGKLVCGRLMDIYGVHKVGRVLYGVLILAGILSVSSVFHIIPLIYMNTCLFGFSLALGTVGLVSYARELGDSETYSKRLKNYQFMLALGQVLVGPVPGAIADRVGSYIPSYILMSLVTLVSVLFIQIAYVRSTPRHQTTIKIE